MSMLELKNLSFEVPSGDGTKEIIDNINLTVEDGKFGVITGPNGGGKSTLAKLIMGIEKPTSGKIFFNGTDVTEMSISERANLSSTPTTAFTLPVGYAPSTTLTGVAIADNSGAMALAQVQIGTDGAVDLSSSTTTTASPVSGVITFVV